MFISNIKDMNFSNVYTCGKTLGNFLIKKGFPLLGRDGDKMKFSNTKELQEVLSHLPVRFEILRKAGVING
ncbi:MAG: hypothetical protein VZQ62_02525 [Methanosphaera sp.]|jgi:hypothetical protein|nr:hypothetical protein [Methanosphaera sp.]